MPQDSHLQKKHCVPCEGGVAPLTEKEYTAFLKEVPDWKVEEGTVLTREFVKKDFKEALRFINAIGDIAENEGHHPDMLLHGWNKVRISLSTHAIGGLSENDFILAAKIDVLS